MLTIKTNIKNSSIHGIGLFAAEYIPKWTIVRKFQENFDQRRSDEDFKKLPKLVQENIIFYWYYNKEEWWYILDGDNSRFTNHSKKPNIEKLNNTETITIKDIKIGDEIMEDYDNFDQLKQKKWI